MKWLPTPRYVVYFQLAFGGVLLATYADLAFYSRLGSEPWKLAATFALGAAYFLLAQFWPNNERDCPSPANLGFYFAIQVVVVVSAMWVSPARGFFAILALPLVSQAIFDLRWRGALLVGVVIYAATIANFYEVGGWRAVWRTGVSYIPGYLFTIAFTLLASGAFRDRRKAEQLSHELSLANAQLRAHAAETEKLATIQERNRLAREIHDGVGHYLTVIKVQLDAADAVMRTDPARAADSIRTAARLAAEALDDVRRSVGTLASENARPPLADMLRQLTGDASPLATFRVEGVPRPLGSAAEHALFRAAQEGLTNLRKHSAATAATLTLDFRDPARVRLMLVDNGNGSSASAPSSANGNGGGHGLRGLRERIALLGGTLAAGIRPEGGFMLSAEVPA